MKRLVGGKSLQAKVLASVLALGVIGVCNIAGAADYYLIAEGEGKTYTDTDASSTQGSAKIVGGWNFDGNMNDSLDKSDVNTNVTVESGDFDEVIGGNHTKRHKNDDRELKIGNTKIVLNGGTAEYVTGGSKANSSDGITLYNGNTSVAVNDGEFNAVIGGNYIKSIGKTSAGTPAKVISTVGTTEVIITGGTITVGDNSKVTYGNVYGGSVAENYGDTQTDNKPDLKVTDENTKVTITGGTIAGSVYAGSSAIGKDSKAEVTGIAAVAMSSGNIAGNLVLGGYANGENATATTEKSTLIYDGGTIGQNIIANAKTADITLNANNFANAFVAESGVMNIVNSVSLTQGNDLHADGGDINFTNDGLEVNLGQIIADKGNITLGGQDAVYNVQKRGITASDYMLVQATNGNKIIFEGKSTNIVGEGDVDGKFKAVLAQGSDTDNKSSINFNADDTVITLIDSGGDAGSGPWGYCVDARKNSFIAFNGLNVTLNDYKKDYTAQNVTVRSAIEFNNAGATNIITTSERSVTGVALVEGTLDFNAGDVNVESSILGENYTNTINAIGIQAVDGKNAQINVRENVGSFNVTVKGQGYDYDGTSYSTGTAALVVSTNSAATINSSKAQFVVNADSKNKGDKQNEAYAVWAMNGGKIHIGAKTDTIISVSNNGDKDDIAVAVMSEVNTEGENKDNTMGGTIELLGNTTITAVGTGEVAALEAKGADSSIIVGSAGKTVSLTGDVLADNGTITLQGSDNTINGVITSTNNGVINLTGENATYNVQHMEASNGGTITVGAGTTIAVDSANIIGEDYLVKVDNGTLTVKENAKIRILNAEKGQTFNIVDGSNEEAWKVENISADNFMLQYEKKEDSNNYIITTTVADAKEVFGSAVLIPDVLTQTLTNGNDGDAAYDFFNAAVDSKINTTKAQAAKAINNAAMMSELAGVSHATYSASNILTDAVADHMSMAKNLDHDTDIWAHYVHNKENIDGLAAGNGGARYDAQYNGIVVGADLYKHGKGTIGAALTYIDGKISGSTRNDAEYYGVSIYGGIENEDSAVIGDISYLHGKNDITQYNSGYTLTGEPKSDALSVGVRAEQSFKAGEGKVVPYAGLRYMHLGTGDYTNSVGLSYDADDANLFLLPVGVKYSAEHKTAGWTLRPIVEVGYVWAMGDRDGQQTVSLNGVSNGFGYDVTDSGSYIGRFALEAEKANVTYGLGYEYQKGDSVKANKWMVNLNWAF